MNSQEMWKRIDGFECYSISNRGSVRNDKFNRPVTPVCDKDGYLFVSLYSDRKRSNLKVHRLVACAFLENPECKKEVDHINLIKSDNRIENLRFATRSENNANRIKKANTSSMFKGVTWHAQRNKWKASIQIDGKNKHIGLFESEAQAGLAYNNYAISHFGEYANLNIIPHDI
jgi:hypothetical protein